MKRKVTFLITEDWVIPCHGHQLLHITYNDGYKTLSLSPAVSMFQWLLYLSQECVAVFLPSARETYAIPPLSSDIIPIHANFTPHMSYPTTNTSCFTLHTSNTFPFTGCFSVSTAPSTIEKKSVSHFRKAEGSRVVGRPRKCWR